MLHHYARKSFDLYFHVNISVSNSCYLHSSTCPNLCTTWYLIKSNRTASMYLCQLLKLKYITYLNYSASWKGNSLWHNIYVPSLNFNLYIPQKQNRWRHVFQSLGTCSRSCRSIAAGRGLNWRWISSFDVIWFGDMTPLLLLLLSTRGVTDIWKANTSYNNTRLMYHKL
jgi:hypothetical protein